MIDTVADLACSDAALSALADELLAQINGEVAAVLAALDDERAQLDEFARTWADDWLHGEGLDDEA